MRGTSDKTKWNWCWSKIGEYYGTPLHLKPNKISGFRDIRHASILNISNMRIRPGPAFPAAICLSSSSRSSKSLHQHRRHSSEDAIFWPALFTAVRWQAHKIFWMASPWKGWNMVMTFASVRVTWNMVKTSRSNTQLPVSSNGHTKTLPCHNAPCKPNCIDLIQTTERGLNSTAVYKKLGTMHPRFRKVKLVWHSSFHPANCHKHPNSLHAPRSIVLSPSADRTTLATTACRFW